MGYSNPEAPSYEGHYLKKNPRLSSKCLALTRAERLAGSHDGKLLYGIHDEKGGKRTPVHLGDVPTHLINATIATEDKDFYTNIGFDPIGVTRAAWDNVARGQIVSGASPITQQLARNVLLDQEERTDQSYGRKLREAVLAIQISQHYAKDQILEMYLNEVYYGHLSYGVEAAAETYFGRRVGDLTLGAGRIWHQYMEDVHSGTPMIDFAPPPGCER